MKFKMVFNYNKYLFNFSISGLNNKANCKFNMVTLNLYAAYLSLVFNEPNY